MTGCSRDKQYHFFLLFYRQIIAARVLPILEGKGMTE